MFPMVICRHYDVVWLDSHTCNCKDCGRQGHWVDDGFVIWMKAGSPPQMDASGDTLLGPNGPRATTVDGESTTVRVA